MHFWPVLALGTVAVPYYAFFVPQNLTHSLSLPSVPLLTFCASRHFSHCHVYQIKVCSLLTLLSSAVSSKVVMSGAPAEKLYRSAPPVNFVELDPNVLVYPRTIVKILENGWDKPFPLTSITYRQCGTAALAAPREDEALHLTADGLVEIRSTTIDSSLQSSISRSDFEEAYAILPGMLRRHLRTGPDVIGGPPAVLIGDAFEAHFDNMRRRLDFSSNFKCYVEYDIRVRQRYQAARPDELFNPAFFQQRIWDDIMATHNYSLAISIPERVRSELAAHARRRSRSPPRRSESEHRSFRRTSPLRDSLSKLSGTRFLGARGPSFGRVPATRSGASARCIFCGHTGHRNRDCPTPLYLTKDKEGNWNRGGLLFCFSFNFILGCSRSPSNCKFSHTCTLCGDGHSAQSCRAV